MAWGGVLTAHPCGKGDAGSPSPMVGREWGFCGKGFVMEMAANSCSKGWVVGVAACSCGGSIGTPLLGAACLG